MYKHQSIQSKVNILVIMMIVSIILAESLFLIGGLSRYLDDYKEEYVKMLLDSFERMVIHDNQQEVLDQLSIIAEHKELESLMADKDIYHIDMLFHSLKATEQLDLIVIDDLDNNRLYEMYQNEEVLVLLNQEGSREDENIPYVTGNQEIGLYIIAGKRVFDSEGTTIGTVIVAKKISKQQYVETIAKEFDIEATIFADNYRYATTIKKDSGVIIGTYLNERVTDEVLNNGNSFYGKSEVRDIPFMTAYKPIFGRDNAIVGILFIGEQISDLNIEKIELILISIGIMMIVLITVYIFTRRYLIREITEPIKSIEDQLRLIGKGKSIQNATMHKKIPKEIYSLFQTLTRMDKRIRVANDEIKRLAFVDSLTGLWNRNKLTHDYSESSLQRLTVFIYINVDNMKSINDLFGHVIGDRLINEIASKLRQLVQREGEFLLYRLSGDEFAICKQTDFTTETVDDFAKKVLKTIRGPHHIEQHNISSSASIGISYCHHCLKGLCANADGHCSKNLEQLLKAAEHAMLHVKSSGKNDYQFYNESMITRYTNRLQLERDLNEAIRNEAFTLYFQPQYDVKKEGFYSFEALIRWNHKEKGFISPAEFIPVAEMSGLIVPIGNWVIKEACAFLKKLNRLGNEKLRVAVNVSAVQLIRNDFVEHVIQIIEYEGIEPSCIELEITESSLIESLGEVSAKLVELRKFGIKIALDDFGTGYSSLTYLKGLPIDILKVDKTFIDDLLNKDPRQNLTGDIIQIGKKLGLGVIAEGVETKEQALILKEYHCDVIQGYYYSKPLPAHEVFKLIE